MIKLNEDQKDVIYDEIIQRTETTTGYAIAKGLGVHSGNIYRYIREGEGLSYDQLKQLGTYLGVDVDELLGL